MLILLTFNALGLSIRWYMPRKTTTFVIKTFRILDKISTMTARFVFLTGTVDAFG